MKLQRTTFVLILLALSLGSFVYFHEIKRVPKQEEVKEEKQPIFSFKEDDVQSLTVKTKNQTLNIEKSGKSDETKWLIKSPKIAPASNAIVGYLMNLLVEGKSERIISISPNQLTEFGLEQPQATIDIKLKNLKTHQLILGKPDFNRRFIYAQADPIIKQDGNINLVLVSTDFENAVNRDLSEWQQLQPINDNLKKPQTTPAPTPAKSKQ